MLFRAASFHRTEAHEYRGAHQPFPAGLPADTLMLATVRASSVNSSGRMEKAAAAIAYADRVVNSSDTSVINASLAGVIQEAGRHECIEEIFGGANGKGNANASLAAQLRRRLSYEVRHPFTSAIRSTIDGIRHAHDST